eukprot:6178883-Pleurochrysis_carterae.AAC.1
MSPNMSTIQRLQLDGEGKTTSPFHLMRAAVVLVPLVVEAVLLYSTPSRNTETTMVSAIAVCNAKLYGAPKQPQNNQANIVFADENLPRSAFVSASRLALFSVITSTYAHPNAFKITLQMGRVAGKLT